MSGDGIVRLPSGGALHPGGTGDGRSVLFLHGVGGGAWSWAPQRDALGGERRTYGWDARGHGLARAVADAGLGDYYVDAREALERVCECDGRAPVVAGHSMGGLLAIALGADAPERVAGLFLVEPVYADGAGYGHVPPAFSGLAQRLCAPLFDSFARNGPVARSIARRMFALAFEDRVHMDAAWRLQRRQVPVEYPRMLRESFGVPEGFPLRDFVRDVRAPVYVLEGSAGRERPRFEEFVAAARERLGARFTYESIAGGHYLQRDRPAEVGARLLAFARSTD